MPESLFSLCLTFIGKNILIVESLFGIPDIIGEALFNITFKNGSILTQSESEDCLRILRLFLQAYGSALLSSLSLKNVFTRLGDIPQAVFEFQNIEQLDLSGCRLDLHCLGCIARLSGLKDLRLQRCGLVDEDLRRLTAVVSMYGEGPKQLSILDLSYNKGISCAAVKFIGRFKQLKCVNLSGTSVKDSGIRQVTACLGLDVIKDDVAQEYLECHVQPIRNQGWAARLVEDWVQDFIRGVKNACIVDKDRKQPAHNFYGAGAKRRRVESVVPCPVDLICSPLLILAKVENRENMIKNQKSDGRGQYVISKLKLDEQKLKSDVTRTLVVTNSSGVKVSERRESKKRTFVSDETDISNLLSLYR